MGNHQVGRIFHAAFSAIDEKIDNMSKDELLTKLDEVGAIVIASTSLDAEFDDCAMPQYPLGRALVKIFNPGFVIDYGENENTGEWYDTIYTPFKKRYGFW